VGENLLKVAEERERLIELLSKVVGELRDGRYDSLVAHVEAEKEAAARVAGIVTREKQCAAKVAELAEGAYPRRACALTPPPMSFPRGGECALRILPLPLSLALVLQTSSRSGGFRVQKVLLLPRAKRGTMGWPDPLSTIAGGPLCACVSLVQPLNVSAPPTRVKRRRRAKPLRG
jgi:hypothetical protein